MIITVKRSTVAACIASLEICLEQFKRNNAPPHILDAAQEALDDLLTLTDGHTYQEGRDAILAS